MFYLAEPGFKGLAGPCSTLPATPQVASADRSAAGGLHIIEKGDHARWVAMRGAEPKRGAREPGPRERHARAEQHRHHGHLDGVHLSLFQQAREEATAPE